MKKKKKWKQKRREGNEYSTKTMIIGVLFERVEGGGGKWQQPLSLYEIEKDHQARWMGSLYPLWIFGFFPLQIPHFPIIFIILDDEITETKLPFSISNIKISKKFFSQEAKGHQ